MAVACQVWQWLHHRVELDDGQVMTTERLSKIMEEELAQLKQKLGAQRYNGGHFSEASKMFYQFSTSDRLADFLTNAAYVRLFSYKTSLHPLGGVAPVLSGKDSCWVLYTGKFASDEGKREGRSSTTFVEYVDSPF